MAMVIMCRHQRRQTYRKSTHRVRYVPLSSCGLWYVAMNIDFMYCVCVCVCVCADQTLAEGVSVAAGCHGDHVAGGGAGLPPESPGLCLHLHHRLRLPGQLPW